MMPKITPYSDRVRPLGNLRCRLLACLGADNPRSPAYFDPPPDLSPKEFLYSRLLDLHHAFAADPESQRVVAAGLLTFGELNRVEEILSSFPDERIQLDHGMGWCPLVPYSTVAAVLPLPPMLRDPNLWIAESVEASALLRWFGEHRDQLRWDPNEEKFILA